MTRITLDLDPAVVEHLTARQHAEGKSLSAVASELLGQALAATMECPAPLEWASHAMGAPMVDLERKGAVWAVLDKP
jgi:glucose-6-phosphate dehydrogenase assembly protein OpcA